MSGKLDYEKDKRKRMPKEPNTDGLMPLNTIGRRPIVVTPKPTEREAKEETQVNKAELKEKLAFVESEKFDAIFSATKKESLLKEIENLIHTLRASTYRSACLSDTDPLIKNAKAVVEKRRLLLPSQPPKDSGLSVHVRQNQTRKKHVLESIVSVDTVLPVK